jgi:hypothetical protein
MLRFVAMNAIETKNLEDFCGRISNEMRDLFPTMTLIFLVSTPEKKADIVAAHLSKLAGHPAINEAFSILKAYVNGKVRSDFLGIAEGQEHIAFNFQKKTQSIALIAIDTSLYDDLNNAIQDVHFYMSLFLDTYHHHLKNPLSTNGCVFLQKISPAQICRQKMKADIYCILQLLRDGQYDAPAILAKRRCLEALTPQSLSNPEEYSFPIALDVINYTIEKHIYSSILGRGQSAMITQFQLAERMTACFDLENFQSWILFTNCSQTMACSGFLPSDILGAAINTSTNPFIKAIGHMLAELSNLAPTDEIHLPIGYNPFLPEEINKISHERIAEETFEMILIHVVEAESYLPLLRVANNQNEALIKGKILGWCASSLHAAAKAYMGAKERGIPPLQAARLEFQSAYLQSNWETLKDLKKHIVTMYRQGEFVTMNELQKWADNHHDAKFLGNSLYITITDPKYTRGLDRPAPEDQLPVVETPVVPETVPEKQEEKGKEEKPKGMILEFDE